MRNKPIISTERLGFRQWNESDIPRFAEMNRNPKVMEFFPELLSRKDTEAFVGRIKRHFDNHGYGLFAVDELASKQFIGFIGFQIATFTADFTPCVEIGWRLHTEYWGRGYATEGGKTCLQYGFHTLNLEEIFSFTAEINACSIAVMEKIGLCYRSRFAHPVLEPDHRLSPHVLYSLRKEEHEARF